MAGASSSGTPPVEQLGQDAGPRQVEDCPKPPADASSDDLNVFVAQNFYAALGLEPCATTRQIREGFRRAALVHHPDKGGHPLKFAFCRVVHDILVNPEKRKLYDAQGRAPFEDVLPKAPKPGAQQAEASYEVCKELINIRFAQQMQELLAMWHMDVTGVPFALVLEYYIRRAERIGGGMGVITVVWRENPKAAELGLQSRRLSGSAGMATLPPELAHETVPSQWRGLSAFGLPKILRFGLRCGFGDRMKDYDQVNAHFVSALDEARHIGVCGAAVLERLVEDPGAFRAEVQASLGCSKAEAKQQVLATGYGQALTEEAPEELKALWADMERVYDAIARVRPEAYKVVKSTWKKDRPKITLGSYVFMHRERMDLDKMAQAAGESTMCYEADGLVVLDADKQTEEAIRASTGRVLRLEPYPQSMAAWRALASERYLNIDFTAVSRHQWRAVQAAYKETVWAVEAGMLSIHTDFALVVAAALEGLVILAEGGLHFFSERERVWKVTNEKPLANIVKTTVHRIWGSRYVRLQFGGKLRADPVHVPASLKRHNWLVDIRMETAAMLVGRAPVYDENRNLVAFSNSLVYDWQAEKMIAGEPWMLISKTLPYAYEAWPSPLHKEYERLVSDIYARFKRGECRLQPGGSEDQQGHELYERIAEVCKKDRLLFFLWQISNYNVDDWAYLNQQLCRMISSCPRFNEFLYMRGPQ